MGLLRNCRRQLTPWQILGLVVAGYGLMVVSAGPLVSAAAVSHGFTSARQLLPGTLAALKNNENNEVVAASTDNVNDIVGVVLASNDAAVAVNAAASTQVATTGSTNLFVSDIAGAIKAGDRLTASPLQGVGMKATDSVKIVGIAERDFADAKNIKSQTIRTRDGQTRQVRVGSIPVRLQVSYYAVPPKKTIVPSFLQQFSNTVAGKEVSALRVLTGFLILLAALVTVGVILFSTMKASVLSIGRNPLASKNVYKSLFQVFGISIVILGLSIGGSYLLVRL